MTAAIRNSHKKFAGPFYAGNRSASDASDISPHKISKKRKKFGLEREFLTDLTVLMGVLKHVTSPSTSLPAPLRARRWLSHSPLFCQPRANDCAPSTGPLEDLQTGRGVVKSSTLRGAEPLDRNFSAMPNWRKDFHRISSKGRQLCASSRS
jgi:hypothetical protein